MPVTVQNFLEICKETTGLTYKNCVVHRIVQGKYMESGDITHGTGRGGTSIYGKSFQEENHVLKHSKAGNSYSHLMMKFSIPSFQYNTVGN